jgi:hypothetical protein
MEENVGAMNGGVGSAAKIVALMARVGMTPQLEVGASTFEPFSDPAATDALGRELGRRIRPLDPNVVCVWDEPGDMVLGHVVGLELGLRWVRCANADGLVVFSGSLPKAARAVIVSDVAVDIERVRAIQNLLAIHGGSVVAVAVLLGTSQLDAIAGDVPDIVSLVRSESV